MANLKILKDKILITGCNGLLGQKLVHAFAHDYDVFGIGMQDQPAFEAEHFQYASCDITRRPPLQSVFEQFEPNFIINAAAYTNVDGCEEDKENCWAVNVTGVENLVHFARLKHAHLIHVSTDYVFDGLSGPYDEESKPNPLGYYARSKLAGENAVKAGGIEHTIVRTMILYGTAVAVRPNFATWLIDQLANGKSVTIVNDQKGHPTLADDLADAILKIVETRHTGVYHIAGPDYLDRYQFALRLADVFNLDAKLITPISTDQLNQKAPRPLNSHFKMDKAKKDLDIQMHGAEDGLRLLRDQLQA